MKVYYLPLEPYPERYTELLTKWTVDRFTKAGLDLVVVLGKRSETSIGVGVVLDASGRCHFALTQLAELSTYFGSMTSEDVVYVDDLFTPGLEALPYYFDQVPKERRPRLYVRNHAQSVDPDDFTFPMRKWMRHFEALVYHNATGVVCGSTVHKEMMEAACLDQTAVHVLGLPYDAEDVRSKVAEVPDWSDRPMQVIYSSRFDKEKQPHLFMDILESALDWMPSLQFKVCTGSAEVRSNDASAVERILTLERQGKVTIHRGCDKATYYKILASSRVQLNTARQDFISYTAVEASTFGTPTLAPAFRSFPEVFHNDGRFMFIPWDVEDAVTKLLERVKVRLEDEAVSRLSHEQHGTLDRIVALFRGEA